MQTIIHEQVAACQAGTNPALVCRAPSGWVVLANNQFLPGYCILLPDPVVAELNDLSLQQRTVYLGDMALVGDALLDVTGAYRINYAIMGNSDPALHAHIVPRFLSEPEHLRRGGAWSYPADFQAAHPFDPQLHRPLAERIAAAIQVHLKQSQRQANQGVTKSLHLKKEELLAGSQAERAALEKLLSDLTPEQMVRPGVLGEWSVKDILTHLSEWEQMFLGWIGASQRGETPAVPAEGYKWNQLAALNLRIYEKYRDLPLPEVLALSEASYQQVMAVFSDLSAEEIFTPARFPWMKHHALDGFFNGNTSKHYLWARKEIQKGLKARRK
jgi:diadenosine tetraphosphate (Ap4A) HIT family hydrolase